MFQAVNTPARKYAKGMGKAVADRTINRKTFRVFKRKPWIKTLISLNNDTLDNAVANWVKNNDYQSDRYIKVKDLADNLIEVKILVTGKYEVEEWEDVAYRVAVGNATLHPVSNLSERRKDDEEHRVKEFESLNHHLRQASILMSGRHLQHGDETQPFRNMEVFTNCATAASSFVSFYLLLNGSGVGRCYDDDMMLVNWSNMPTVVCVLDQNHKDVQSGEIVCMDRKNAEHLYAHKEIVLYEVPDSREGWAKAVEKIEIMAFEGVHEHKVLLIDFSKVRPKGSPIKGMQDRPASGPAPLITSICSVATIKNTQMPIWRQTMYVDHYLAECVLVGGARRAARMSTKTWRDPGAIDFVNVKRGGFLWSSNNSVTVDKEFWKGVNRLNPGPGELINDIFVVSEDWANKVFNSICEASYKDGTGEPGIINQDMLVQNDWGIDAYKTASEFIGSEKYRVEPETIDLLRGLAASMRNKPLNMITNPCGEIALNVLGGYCVIADVVPYHATSDDDAEDAFRTAVRALIRTNTMDCLYGLEVKRTNRIGVGMTGIHEYAWKRFGYGWKDLVDEEKSKDFWLMLSRFKRAVVEEASTYCNWTGAETPHTNTTVKPAGTTSKLFGLTEGAHLPSMREYLRWVQMANTDPLIKQYEALGYPVKKLKIYAGTTIVGFPTRPEICKLGMGDKLVTAAEATPVEQYQYLKLLEKYWIVGEDKEDGGGDQFMPWHDTGNQVSYTLKYDPKVVNFEAFKKTLLEYQSQIRCCSVMPQTDTEAYAYEYLPEHPVTKHEYEQIVNAINDEDVKEDVDFVHVDCENGACPIDFNKNSAARV